MNFHSLGIEFLVPGIHDLETFYHAIDHTSWLTDAQYAAGIIECKSWIKAFGIKEANVYPHSGVDPDNKRDPGQMFPWLAFMEALYND